MNKKYWPKILILLVITGIFLCFASGASLGASPVSIIRQPVLTDPEIIDRSTGGKLTVRLDAGCQLLQAVLTNGDNAAFDVPVPASGVGAGCTCELDLPAAVRPGLYGLKVVAKKDGAEKTDFQPRSVWIVDRQPDEFKFAYIADSHFGDPRAFMSKSAPSPDERRLLVYKAAVSSGARFIVMAGDLVSVPVNLSKEYPGAYKEILGNVTIPVFPAPGNHDLYAMSDTNPKQDGLTFWHNYFGPDYYSFRLGNIEFIALNTFDWPQKFRNFMDQAFMNKMGSYTEGVVSKTQYDWLKEKLAEAEKNKNTVIVFAHHNLINSFAAIDKNVTPDLMAQEDVAALLGKYDVRYYLAGHNHQNTDETAGKIEFQTVTSSSSQINPGDSWGYKLCSVTGRNMKCEYVPVVYESR